MIYKIQTDSLTEDSQRKLEHFIKITRDLNKYAQALQKEMIIEISGHSDTTGEEHFNKEISLHRANKIGDIFTKNQFNETQLVLYGMGSTVTRNENISASEKRRVEIEILFKND